MYLNNIIKILNSDSLTDIKFIQEIIKQLPIDELVILRQTLVEKHNWSYWWDGDFDNPKYTGIVFSAKLDPNGILNSRFNQLNNWSTIFI